MSLILDTTLQAAQDGTSHHPIISLMSSKPKGDIPFVGQALNPSSYSQISSSVILHSSGRICSLYAEDGPTGDKLVYVYTDPERISFTKVTLLQSGINISSACICEIDADQIGIVFVSGGTVYTKIISVTGDEISTASPFTISGYLSGPYVLKVGTGFVMVYVDQTADSSLAYRLMERTSADFMSWSDASEISTGLDTTAHVVSGPSLLETSNGLFCFFTYQNLVGENEAQITNIYYVLNAGAGFAPAIEVTNYTDFSARGLDPYEALSPNGDIYIALTEQRTLLSKDLGARIVQMCFDSENRKLYLYCARNTNATTAIYKINVDTWAIEDTWTPTTTPPCPPDPDNWDSICENNYANGWIIPIFERDDIAHGMNLAVFNGRTGVITYYSFVDDPGNNILRNSFGYPDLSLYYSQGAAGSWRIEYVKADPATAEHGDRVWILWCYRHGSITAITELKWGYIDLDAGQGGDGLYPYNNVAAFTLPEHWFWNLLPAQIEILVDDGLLIYGAGPQGNACFVLDVLDLQSGARIKHYTSPYQVPAGNGSGLASASFPVYGVTTFFYHANTLYCSFAYTTDFNNGDRRGLFVIDMNMDSMRYLRPSYVSVDDYKLGRMCMNAAGTELWIASGYGLVKLDLTTEQWTQFIGANVPGISSDDFYNDRPAGGIVLYDDAAAMVYSRMTTAFPNLVPEILIGLPTDGLIETIKYVTGNPGAWSSPSPLVIGNSDRDPSICIDPTGMLYAFWTRAFGDITQIYWDRAVGDFELADYLVRSQEISWTRTIDGSPSQLTFTLSRGHLFDTHNKDSLLSTILKKGMILTLRVGERISGVDYYQAQGKFRVDQRSLSYKKTDYPTIQVTGKCDLALWADDEIFATENYVAAPDAIIADLIHDFTDMGTDDYDIPSFGTELTHQWLDTALSDIIKQICDRFSYYPRFGADGKFTVKKIADDSPVDHVYSDLLKIVDFSPDDTYSDHTCKIVVIGYEKDYTNVFYTEERITALSGTVGWWGYKKDFTIYYSDDRSRTCINPRLVVLESVTSIAFKLEGQITETITYVDPLNKYCIVTIEAPNLIPELIAGISFLVTSYFWPDLVDSYSNTTKRVGSYMSAFAVWMITEVLGAVGNYQYEIWAQPAGQIRRTVEGEAADYDYQQELGLSGDKMVTKKIEDTLCYTATDCSDVASQELMVVKLQRKRVKFSKVAHLQDEEGDTIEIVHPISKKPMGVLVTNLTRKLLMGDNADGYFTDDIEGWDLTP
jgi:hypothetical protein